MNRLRANPLIFWLLMFCIGLQGIGSAAHRISHDSHGYAHNGLAAALEKSDKGAAQTTELCLVCANLSAAKSFSPTLCWMADTTFREHQGEGCLVREIDSQRRLFALARAPPTDLS